jgi:hypothetical protein
VVSARFSQWPTPFTDRERIATGYPGIAQSNRLLRLCRPERGASEQRRDGRSLQDLHESLNPFDLRLHRISIVVLERYDSNNF